MTVATAQTEIEPYKTLQEAVDLYRQLATGNPDQYRPDLALSLVSLGAQFAELDSPLAALTAGQEAVNIYRELAEVDPDWYRPNLAFALRISRCATIGIGPQAGGFVGRAGIGYALSCASGR